MNDLVPLSQTQHSVRQLDAERLIKRWQEGRSPHTVRAYGRDLAYFARWSKAAAPGEAITCLLIGTMGEANERLHAYRGAMLDAGLAPATVNRIDLEHVDIRASRLWVLGKGRKEREAMTARMTGGVRPKSNDRS
jgi:site-specific recombinase XerD